LEIKLPSVPIVIASLVTVQCKFSYKGIKLLPDTNGIEGKPNKPLILAACFDVLRKIEL
jgi:hypothetical protein